MSKHRYHLKQPERMTCPLNQCQCSRSDGARCGQCTLDYHCGSHDDGCHRSCAGPQRARAGFRRFEGYRASQPLREQIGPEDPSSPRFEGVVFSDGTCVVRWGGKVPSTIVFTSFTAMMRVHGHPEYGTAINWLDEIPAERGALWSPAATGWASASTAPPAAPGLTRSTSSRSPGG
jgi:hypothetical protein